MSHGHKQLAFLLQKWQKHLAEIRGVSPNVNMSIEDLVVFYRFFGQINSLGTAVANFESWPFLGSAKCIPRSQTCHSSGNDFKTRQFLPQILMFIFLSLC